MSRMVLKHPSGFFAAGTEMGEALTVLGDGAFKLYVYVCLHADRGTGQLRFRMAELAKAIGHGTRSLTVYLDELQAREVGLVYRAANQHETGRIEIRERFWPYEKQNGAEDPERSLYVSRVRGLFVEMACVRSSFSTADEKLAAEWYREGVPLEVVERAFLIGSARKYVALDAHPEVGLIVALEYFRGALEEVQAMELNLNYWRYLAMRVARMERQWRAHADSAPAAPAKTPEETK